MTIEANQGPFGLSAPSCVTADERIRAFGVAARHSRLVRVLRVGLPTLALAALASYFIGYFATQGVSVSLGNFEASIARLELSRDALRMVNPRMEGRTDDGGVYSIRADYADQSTAESHLVALTGLSAEVTKGGGNHTKLTAPSGRYDTKAERLDLNGPIAVVSDNGMTAHLQTATLNLKAQLITSAQPVKVEALNGEIHAASLSINLDNSEVVFDRDVRVHIRGRQATGPKAGETSRMAVSLDRGKPIDITAPRLKIANDEKAAYFLGSVTAVQGTSRLTAGEMRIEYTDGAGENGAERGDIQSIEASSDVRLVSDGARTATADRLTFDARKQSVTLDGNVTLSQGDDIMKGQRFVSDLASGKSWFEPIGRVRSHFAARGTPVAASEATPAGHGPGQLDLSSTRGKPLDIESDSMSVDEKAQLAVFKGEVEALQGSMTLRSRELHVSFAKGPDGGAAGLGGSQISKVNAQGKVYISTKPDQAVTSDWALFDAASQTVTIGGNVVLSQGENVIKGDRLVIDVRTGRSRFENERDVATGGRVRGLFKPKSSESKSPN